MAIPETRKEMQRAGYVFLSFANCGGCSARVEWWKTTRGARLSFVPNADNNATAQLHRLVCGKPAQQPVPQDATPFRQQDAQQLLRRTGARIVLAIYDDGHVETHRASLTAADVWHELFNAATKIDSHTEATQP